MLIGTNTLQVTWHAAPMTVQKCLKSCFGAFWLWHSATQLLLTFRSCLARWVNTECKEWDIASPRIRFLFVCKQTLYTLFIHANECCCLANDLILLVYNGIAREVHCHCPRHGCTIFVWLNVELKYECFFCLFSLLEDSPFSFLFAESCTFLCLCKNATVIEDWPCHWCHFVRSYST